MEEVLFETERSRDREQIADYLRAVADKLDSGEAMTLSAGDQSVTLDVPARPTFEVKAEREQESGGTELSVEFELEWKEGESSESGGGDLEIG
ncbi:amphi-Trp domain-containing protein [Halobacteriales archaeon QS_8_69_26]|nr:MAG: amphi-Trp domain-containing protein [Halobacteriales archaeon QS_8_69_26]